MTGIIDYDEQKNLPVNNREIVEGWQQRLQLKT